MNYDYAAGQQTASMLGFQQAGEAPKPEMGSQRLTSTMGRAAELCARVEGLADRLCGSVPQAVSSTGNQIKGIGPAILPQLDAHASELDDFVQRAHSAISRIESFI